MCFVHKCVVFLFLFLHVCGFNLDTNNPIVYEDPGKTNQSNSFSSYFGYAILLFPGSKRNPEKWIKIGAPRGQDSRTNFKNSGLVYDCPLKKGCEAVSIPNGTFDENRNEFNEILENSWIGGTMDISYTFERISICGFRRAINQSSWYKKNIMDGSASEIFLVGGCYVSYINKPFELKTLDVLSNETGYRYALGQLGFSAHFPMNTNLLLLGAPGVDNWDGAVVSVRKKPIVRNNIGQHFAWSGYAITSGYFYRVRNLYYAIGSPRYNLLKGTVEILNFTLNHKEWLAGNQLGEYFGASLSAGDINKDDCDDLIVGAPYHAIKTYNEGRVVIYLGNCEKNQGNRMKKNVVIYGKKAKNAQFGSAVMFLDDINGDGYGDVAIGAPYEEEYSGVLYIYKGKPRGLDRKYTQRIIGKDISQEIRGFGISISRPADIDNNEIKDIAVGAHLSANAILLRSRPVLEVNYNMKSIPKVLKEGSNNFTLEICYWYTSVSKNIITDITRTIVIDEGLGRAVVGSMDKEVNTIKFFNKENVCENITIYVTPFTDLLGEINYHVHFSDKRPQRLIISIKYPINPATPNFKSPITTSMSCKVANQVSRKGVMYISDEIRGNDSFCDRCPVLEKCGYKSSSSIKVPFVFDCGDDVCKTNLSIDVTVQNLDEKNAFLVGSQNSVHLVVIVRNTGEKAYSTRLETRLPNTIAFGDEPSHCQSNNSVMICDIGNPLKENSERATKVNLNMQNVNTNYNETELNITFSVVTVSNNVNTGWKTFKIKLRRSCEITIHGKSEEQSLPFDHNFRMPNFTHVYQVENLGVSPLEKVLMNITIPYALRTINGNIIFMKIYQPEAVFSEQSILCTSDILNVYDTNIDSEESRRKRSVVIEEVFKETNESLRANDSGNMKYENIRVYNNKVEYINCSAENIICSSVLCSLSPFEKGRTYSIKIKFMFDGQEISDLLEAKNLILYATHGSVTIDSPGSIQSIIRPNFVDVSIVFINQHVKGIALWITVLSAVAGLLFLILIVYGLWKVGFFNRAKRDELKNLKAGATKKYADEDNSISSDLNPPGTNSSSEGLLDISN